MIGIPGSGKSTYAESLGCRVVSPDTVREICRVDSPEAFSIARSLIAASLIAGESVVFDATNTIWQYRAENIVAGKPYADRVVCVWMDTPLEVCLARHHTRQEQGIRTTLPDSVIVRMAQQLRDNPPELSEGFDEIRRIKSQS